MNEYPAETELIEKKSMQVISKILGDVTFSTQQLEIIKRIILATADFHYAKILQFNHNPIEAAMSSIRRGRNIVTDIKIDLTEKSAKLLDKYGVKVVSFTGDGAKSPQGIYVVGTDASALNQVLMQIEKKEIEPDAVIGVPVGFVGVSEAKEELGKLNVPHILTEGQKGGISVAMAIINALAFLTELDED